MLNEVTSPLLLLIIVCMLTYSFEIVFGLAGTIMMITVMVYFFDAKTLVIYSILPQILVGSIGILRSPKTVKIHFLLKMLGFASVGAFAGVGLFYYLSTSIFQTLLAAVVTLFGLFLVVTPEKMKLNPFAGRVLDVLAGASQALFGISGPVAMTRLMATFDEKVIVRNYALAFFLALNLFRALGYMVNNSFTPEILRMILISAPFLFVTLWFSNHLHFRVNERVFRQIVSWVILLGGLSLFSH